MGNIQGSQASVIETMITDVNLTAALRKAKGPDSQMVSWEVKNFTAKGDNYVGIVTSTEVKYLLQGQESSISFIVKLSPLQSSELLQEVISYAFVKEARVYKELIPLLNNELTSLGFNALRFPECFYTSLEAGREVIYLQDLRSLGFKTFDRKKTLDLPHTALVLKELGRLHASSLLLQVKEDYRDLDNKFQFICKDLFDLSEDSIKLSSDTLDKYIEKTINTLTALDNYKATADWLRKIRPDALQRLLRKLDNNTRFAVVCHGDCWNNNILFRYDAAGNPNDIMLIDLQILRRASLAIDLQMLFYHSLAGPDRKSHLDYYLDIYYASFRSVMEAGGLAMPFTREELAIEYESKHLYGCLWAMTCLPSIISDSEDIPDEGLVGDIPTDSIEPSQDRSTDPEKNRQDNILSLLEKNPEIKARFLSIFDDVVEKEKQEEQKDQ